MSKSVSIPNRRQILITAVATLAVPSFQSRSQAAPPITTQKSAVKGNTLSPVERKAGWQLLFDGKTLTGWRGYKKPEIGAAWKAVDGALTLDGPGGGDIMTDQEFSDFELTLDWKISEGGNSGLMYRVGATDAPPYVTGPEYQLLDDERHPDAKLGRDGNRKSGSLYDVLPAAKNVVKAAGEWNAAKVLCKGKHIEHWLNGTRVVQTDLGSPDWNQRVAASKWKPHPEFGTLTTGRIDLQDHGNKVEFRNIKIRSLSTPAKK